MKVLLCARSDYTNSNSGDMDIIFKIYNFLKERNLEVQICGASEEVDYGKFDIVHLFDVKNIFDTYTHFKRASNYKCNIVVSPMYFNMSRFFEYTNNISRVNSWNNCKAYRELILKKSKLIMCNSNYERELIARDFGVRGKVITVHNGVKVNYEDIPLYDFKSRYAIDKYVLCVGRICEYKNQLILSKVCNELKINLVLVGTAMDEEYLKACLKYKTTSYLGFMKEYDLYNAYTFAKVHVLASFSEVTSLSSLKAGAQGCNIVVSEEGASREYFKDMAVYCDPYEYDSIKNAVKKAISTKKNDKLKNYIRDNYRVDRMLEEIYKGYLLLTK